MNIKQNQEPLFKLRNSIMYSLDQNDLEWSRKVISKANGPLFYIFGNTITNKYWLPYLERFDK